MSDVKKRVRVAISLIRNAINVYSYRYVTSDLVNRIDEECFDDNRRSGTITYFIGEYRAEYRLAYSVLKQALIDLAASNLNIRRSAEEFLKNDPWCNSFLKIDSGYMLLVLKRLKLIEDEGNEH